MSADLIIVGASVRAAAQSARRAGFRPWCVDLFGDCDLAAMAPVRRLDRKDYPDGLVPIVRDGSPPAPVIYTGGLENHPHVYTELARHRPVWGYLHPSPFDADSVRNPAFLADVCCRENIAHPRWKPGPATVPTDASWLAKSYRGSGGTGVSIWSGQDLNDPSRYFWQEKIAGPSFAATFIARQDRVELLGVTQQLVGEPWLHAPGPFAYSGSLSVGASESDGKLVAEFCRIGSVLRQADRFLRGLFGIDAVWCDGELYVIEVNPRYTSSVEVIEWANGGAILVNHARAFQAGQGGQEPPPLSSHPRDWIGKAVYYAPWRLTAPALPCLAAESSGCPGVADVPAAGTLIEQGEPMLTLLSRGSDVEGDLRGRAAELDRLLA